MTPTSQVLAGFVLPGLPQPLLTPDANPGYRKLRTAFENVKLQIENLNPDVILIYSTMWPSVIGHQIQAMPRPKWVHVDEEFHDLGSIPYEFKIDADLAKVYCEKAQQKGLQARTVAYEGFPIDTGSVVALKLINPENRFPAVIVSSNIYADRAETVVLGKAALEALKQSGKTAVAIIVSTFSNRLHSEFIDPKKDHIHSLKDQEWNQKVLEFLKLGRLEDVAQLSRQIHREARVKKVSNFKPFWWLSALMGSHNRYSGDVMEYQPIYGTGCAVVSLVPALIAARDLEFDEENPDYYRGDRNVLGPSAAEAMSSQTTNPGEQVEEGDV